MGYTPALVSETSVPSPWKLCTAAAGAMLLDKQTLGSKQWSLTKFAGEIGLGLYPLFGLTLGQLTKAFTAAGQTLAVNNDAGWSQVLLWGEADRGMVVQGNYWKLPSTVRLQQPGATDWNGAHSIYVDRIVGNTVYYMDPLQHSGGMRTMTVPALEAYATGFSDGKIRVAVGKVNANPSPAPSTEPRVWYTWVTEWAASKGLPASTKLTPEYITEFLNWYARKQSPNANASTIASLVAEFRLLTNGWEGKTVAELAAKEQETPASVDPLTAIGDAATSFAGAISFIMDPQNWIRVFAFALGLFLLSMGSKMVFDASARAV